MKNILIKYLGGFTDAEMQNSQTSISDLRTRLNLTQARSSNFRTERDKLVEIRHELEQEMKTLDQAHVKVIDERDKLLAENEKLRTEFGDQAQELAKVQDNNACMIVEIDKLKIQRDDFEAKWQKLRKHIDKKNAKPKRHCKFCKKNISHRHHLAKYCDDDCKELYYTDKN